MQQTADILGTHPSHKTLAGMSTEDNRSCSITQKRSSETPSSWRHRSPMNAVHNAEAHHIPNDVVFGNSSLPRHPKTRCRRNLLQSQKNDRDTNCPMKTSSLIFANYDETNTNSGEATGNPGNGQVVTVGVTPDLVSQRLRPGPQMANGLYPFEVLTALEFILHRYMQAVSLLMFAFLLGFYSLHCNDCISEIALSGFAYSSVILPTLVSLPCGSGCTCCSPLL